MTTIARGRRTSSHRKGDVNERAIIDTAERLLAEVPLADISVADLARGAGISRSSFYFYFASKHDVLLALLDAAAGELQVAVEAMAANVAQDPRGQISGGIAATGRLWREHGPALRGIVAAAATDDEVRAIWSGLVGRFVDVNAAMIRAERERGAAPDTGPSPEQLATALVRLNEHAFHLAAVGDPPALGDDAAAVLTEIWLRSIYGRDDV
jgi:AcrR family transcriptional regulator